jgi:hypothetical protein
MISVVKKEYLKNYYENNKEKLKERSRNWNKDNKKRAYLRNIKNRSNRINSWVEYLPKETTCEICGRKIFFKGHPRFETIHFDHKSENCAIKTDPSSWIESKYRTKENQEIWDSCRFGCLCKRCNSFLPTKDRKEWLRKAVAYANKP